MFNANCGEMRTHQSGDLPRDIGDSGIIISANRSRRAVGCDHRLDLLEHWPGFPLRMLAMIIASNRMLRQGGGNRERQLPSAAFPFKLAGSVEAAVCRQ